MSSFEGVERRGLMFVLSSPAGAGKTTLTRMLIALWYRLAKPKALPF